MENNKVKVTLIKSTIGSLKVHKDTVASLGLTKIHQSKVFENNACLQGKLAKVSHLVKVEKV